MKSTTIVISVDAGRLRAAGAEARPAGRAQGTLLHGQDRGLLGSAVVFSAQSVAAVSFLVFCDLRLKSKSMGMVSPPF